MPNQGPMAEKQTDTPTCSVDDCGLPLEALPKDYLWCPSCDTAAQRPLEPEVP